MKKYPRIKNEKDFADHFQSEFWIEAATQICRRHKIFHTEIKRANSSDHVVFLIDDLLVLKIYRPFRNCFERETSSLEFIGGKTIFKVPEIVQIGEFEGFQYVLMTQIEGISMTRQDWLLLSEFEQMTFISKLAHGLRQIHQLDSTPIVSDWAEFVEDRAATFIARQIAHGVNQKILDALPVFIEENLCLVPTDKSAVFMHGDVHFGNLRVSKSDGEWQISGLFDFADSRCGFHEYEFLAVGVLMIQGQGKIQREFFEILRIRGKRTR